MGGGIKRESAVEVSRRPLGASSEDGAAGGGSAGQDQQQETEVHPCQAMRPARFEAIPGAVVAVGLPVAVALPNQPMVVAALSGADLGELRGADASKISNCMLLGYPFAGRVTAWNPTTREVTVEIGGL